MLFGLIRMSDGDGREQQCKDSVWPRRRPEFLSAVHNMAFSYPTIFALSLSKPLSAGTFHSG